MNITLLVNLDLAANYALNLLLPQLSKHRLSLFYSSKVGHGDVSPKLTELAHAEQDFFNNDVCAILDSRVSEKDKYTASEQSHQLKSQCSQMKKEQFKSWRQLNYYLENNSESLNDINTSQGQAKLTKTNPDLIISIRFGKILSEAVINIPTHGTINLHSGLLPQYRGVMATFWSMYHQAKVIGTTLHWIDSSAIDRGKIIECSTRAVDYSQDYLMNTLSLYPQGVSDIVDAVAKISQGQDVPEYEVSSLNKDKKENYFSFPSTKQLEEFGENRLFNKECLFNWLNDNYGIYLPY